MTTSKPLSRWALATTALLALGCENLIGLDDLEFEQSEGCRSDPGELRLWTLGIGRPDYFALKNPTPCAIELGGVHVMFDDRDEEQSAPFDCLLRLPDVLLPAGASLRVHEQPQSGDLHIADTEFLQGCTNQISFNPVRGGFVYLCRGDCDAGVVIDAFSFVGDSSSSAFESLRAPPANRFDVSFLAPPTAVVTVLENSWRFQRVALNGTYPDYVGNDWVAQQRTFFADFEMGVTATLLDRRPVAWERLSGQLAEIETTTELAASDTASLRIVQTGESGTSDALTQTLTELPPPREITYFARAGAPAQGAAHLELRSEAGPLVAVGFESDVMLVETRNDVRQEVKVFPDGWYRVELRNFEWLEGTFDWHVNGMPVAEHLAFGEAGTANELRLFSTESGATSFFDGLEFWSDL